MVCPGGSSGVSRAAIRRRVGDLNFFPLTRDSYAWSNPVNFTILNCLLFVNHRKTMIEFPQIRVQKRVKYIVYITVSKDFIPMQKEIEDFCILNGKHVGTYNL